MNWKQWAKNMLGGARQAKGPHMFGGKLVSFHGPVTSVLVTPEPDYICKNCGMLIKSCHGHTVDECESYDNDPTKPDLSLRMILKEKRTRHGLNDPRIRLPTYYQSSSKVKNE